MPLCTWESQSVKFLAVLIIIILALLAAMPWIKERLPAQYNPFAPLSVTDPPTIITRYKLKRLATNPEACLAVITRARDDGWVSFRRIESMHGRCPLAVNSVMFVTDIQQHHPMASPLVRIDHLGSYACRNISHREQGRLSEHATADAFRLQNGERMSVLDSWRQSPEKAAWLQQTFRQSCRYFGNAPGPQYNAAHANHFHLGTGGFGVCR